MEKMLLKPSAIMYPVPIVLVSCGNENVRNIITVAWTGIINSEPPMAYISVRPERYSYDLIKDSGEFVINIPGRALANAVDYCGIASGRNCDKFSDMRLTPIKGEVVGAPLIKECPVNIECTVENIQKLGSHDMFIGKIVACHADDNTSLGLAEGGNLQADINDKICYANGHYVALGEILGKKGFSHKK